MNRYLIFAGKVYYSTGGGCDFIASINDLDDASDFAKSIIGKEVETLDKTQPFSDDQKGSFPVQWSHIFDVKEVKIIAEFGNSPLGRDSEIVRNSL